MKNLTNVVNGRVYELTDNEFNALYLLVSDCLENMGGSRPSDIHEDPLTWTDSKVLWESGKWTKPESRGTYSALGKKGLITIETKPEWPDVTEDMVNDFVFDMFDTIWDEINISI